MERLHSPTYDRYGGLGARGDSGPGKGPCASFPACHFPRPLVFPVRKQDRLRLCREPMIVPAGRMKRAHQPKQVTKRHEAHEALGLPRFLQRMLLSRPPMKPTRTFLGFVLALLSCVSVAAQASQPQSAPSAHSIVLHAARLLDVESGHITAPGEILVSGDAIVEVGAKVTPPLRRRNH
jgi:hypothetical protein